MNERVMQFRIGMFVIVAGLVLTMLIVWFGELPTLFQDYNFLTVHFAEAPGVAVGIPVRKSGIRIGSVTAIKFDDRPGHGDGVLVTLSLEKHYRLAHGAEPRITRALIGDASIDMLPGAGSRTLVLSHSPGDSLRPDRIIEGSLAPDPASALAAATKAFERAGETLQAIDDAARGITKITDSAENFDELISTWKDTGRRMSSVSDNLDQVVRANKEKLGPAIDSLRSAADGINQTLDEPTRKNVQAAARNIASAAARIDATFTDLQPLATDLGAAYGTPQRTHTGQLITRLNQVVFEVSMLTSQLVDPNTRQLRRTGTLQKLIVDDEMYNNFNRLSVSLREVVESLRPALRNLNAFSERISRDPSVLGRGILNR